MTGACTKENHNELAGKKIYDQRTLGCLLLVYKFLLYLHFHYGISALLKQAVKLHIFIIKSKVLSVSNLE
jgi:hypothetical protein